MAIKEILLMFNTLPLLLPVQAWSLVWRNATNDSFVEHSDSVKSCTKINNPKGMLFEYDSEGDPFAISLYGNGDCSDSPTGYATQYLSKNTSSAIHSYKVDSHATDSSEISITTSPSPTQVTESPTGATVLPRYRPELTGGEIAGIVIGAIVGATIVGGIIFFLARYRQRASENIVSQRRAVSPLVRVVELAGNYAPTELDSNALRSELEGHELAKPRVTS